MKIEKEIFRAGSTTYYFSSIFFPKKIKDDVFRLYSFVRVADDYVDAIPAKKSQFKKLRKLWDESINDAAFNTEVSVSDDVNYRVVKNMVYVTRKYHFEPQWITAFLDSMQADLDLKKYRTLDDTIWYMYGSAEVIGMMMAKIMGLPKKAYPFAMMQGRAMQYINFIRDIAEDNTLGRQYFPASELKKYNLPNIKKNTAKANPEIFNEFIQAQLQYYELWQSEANRGFNYIPKRIRIPLQTATDMYNWTAIKIAEEPLIVFDKKIKPSKIKVISTALLKIL